MTAMSMIVGWPMFPWIQIHGPIEASSRFPCPRRKSCGFPWIQIHGPIEATVDVVSFRPQPSVSVDSNPRPH